MKGFTHFLAVRIPTARKPFLQLARKLGKPDPRSLRIEQRLTHEALAAMVATTRPRISTFMRRFLELGLIDFSAERLLIVKEGKLSAYLGQIV